MAINWDNLTDEEICARIRSSYLDGSLIVNMAKRLEEALLDIYELEAELEALPDTFAYKRDLTDKEMH